MKSAIIVAAGRGTRMGPTVDKLFLEVHGKPVVAHTWRLFDAHPSVDEIILVVRDGMQSAFSEIAAAERFKKPFRMAPGGKERQDSVWNGLEALSPPTRLVAIHDGARPCVHAQVIQDCFNAAETSGAAVAAQAVTDTIKESDSADHWISRHLDRSLLFAVQTPQTFKVDVIKKALAAVRSQGLIVTDDTAACELIGVKVKLVLSAHPNPKVTHPSDLPLVASLLRP